MHARSYNPKVTYALLSRSRLFRIHARNCAEAIPPSHFFPSARLFSGNGFCRIE